MIHLLTDFLYLACSEIADASTTCLFAKKFGADRELHNETREGIKREGTLRYLTKNGLKWIGEGVLIAGTLYGADYLLGIQDNWINLHHVPCYGIGTLKYLASLNNAGRAYGLENFADAVSVPLVLYSKIFGGKKYFRDP